MTNPGVRCTDFLCWRGLAGGGGAASTIFPLSQSHRLGGDTKRDPSVQACSVTLGSHPGPRYAGLSVVRRTIGVEWAGLGQSREIVVLRVAPVFQGSMPVLLMRTLEVRSVGAWERAAKIVGKIKKQKKNKVCGTKV